MCRDLDGAKTGASKSPARNFPDGGRPCSRQNATAPKDWRRKNSPVPARGERSKRGRNGRPAFYLEHSGVGKPADVCRMTKISFYILLTYRSQRERKIASKGKYAILEASRTKGEQLGTCSITPSDHQRDYAYLSATAAWTTRWQCFSAEGRTWEAGCCSKTSRDAACLNTAGNEPCSVRPVLSPAIPDKRVISLPGKIRSSSGFERHKVLLILFLKKKYQSRFQTRLSVSATVMPVPSVRRESVCFCKILCLFRLRHCRTSASISGRPRR